MAESPESTRATAQIIYARVLEDAETELDRSSRALAFSGLFAGFTIGATPLAMALTLAMLDGGAEDFVAALLYPIGFVAVIIGRAQLFTENTLYPAVASLHDRRHLAGTGRLWTAVLAANTVGGALFALLAVESGVVDPPVVDELAGLGAKAADAEFTTTFWSAVVAGWLLALVAWLVEATETAVGQVFVIWTITVVVGLGAFNHSVATAVEVVAALFHGDVSIGGWLSWLGTVVVGNIAGGVMIVSLLNFAQVRSEPR